MSLSLRSCSDSDILSRTLHLRRHERSVTLQVLLHLNEIETRQLHLKQGYSSMFDYCRSALGYSESAANRRIQSARCVARFPEVYALLDANEVNLSTIAKVHRIMNSGNKDAILDRIRGKSQDEVTGIVAEYLPRHGRADSVRPVVVPVAPAPVATLDVVGPAVSAGASTNPVVICASSGARENSAYRRSGGAFDTAGTSPAGGRKTAGAAHFERCFEIGFTAGEVFMKKYARVARGGVGTADNLRLLCAYHNRLECERLMGPVGTARAIESREAPPRR